MDLSVVLKLLEENKEKFKCVDFAYILPTQKLEYIQFDNRDDLDRFTNSRLQKNEEENFILLRTNEFYKCFAISMPGYQGIIVNDGMKLSVSSYSHGKPQPPVSRAKKAPPIDLEAFRKEIEKHFLEQEGGNLAYKFH